MTSRSDRPQAQYAVYRVSRKASGSGLEYNLSAGPYTERKQALHKAEELNQSEPEVYFSYVVSEYKGESWSPERPSSFTWEIDTRD
jgi:hypothetical protein